MKKFQYTLSYKYNKEPNLKKLNNLNISHFFILTYLLS